MITATAQALEGYGRIAKRSAGKSGHREVRGFISTADLDRHQDMIDPALFDVGTFLKNPQLFVDHQPWLTAAGNPISVGRVTSLIPAKAVEKDDGSFDIVSIEDDTVIDTVPKEEADIVQNGQKGLWGVVEVMEKDVIQLVNDGRLNAFSWRGDLIETRFGKHIDLMEVSLVYIPANAKALFMVTKSSGVREVNTYVVVKGTNAFADLRQLPKNVAAVVDYSVPKFCLYIKHENGRAEVTELSLKEDAEADAFSASVYAARRDVESVTLLKNTYLMTDREEPIYEVMNDLSRTEMIRAQWTRAYINNLPDSAFAFIEDGGKIDSEGKTVPRSLRHFPLKNSAGNYDEAHVRNALARMSQSEFGEKAKPKILAAARALGIEVSKKSFEEGETHTTEGGEEEMSMNQEEQKSISEVIAGVVRDEFKKVLDALSAEEQASAEEKTSETKTAEAKAEEAKVVEKTNETIVSEAKAEGATDAGDLATSIASAVRSALEAPMSELSKRIEKLEKQEQINTNAATEAEEDKTVLDKKKSVIAWYNSITDPAEKKKARLRLLDQAMFGDLKQVNS